MMGDYFKPWRRKIFSIAIGLFVALALFMRSNHRDEDVWSRAVSPDGTWYVKLLGKFESSYYIMWMEAFSADDVYLGRFYVASLEGRDEAFKYSDVSCTTTEARCGGGVRWPFPYTIAAKTDFIPARRGSKHKAPGMPLPPENQPFQTDCQQ